MSEDRMRTNSGPQGILRSKLRELEAKHHTALETIESLQAEVERLQAALERQVNLRVEAEAKHGRR